MIRTSEERCMVVKAAVYQKGKGFQAKEFVKPQLGQNDILMKIKLCGICGTDVHFWKGLQGISEPYVMGHEFIGEVTEGGSKKILDERGLKIGDQIAVEIIIPCHHCSWCKKGKYNLCLKDDLKFGNGYGRQYGCNIPLTRPPTPLWGGFSQVLYVPKQALVHKYEKRTLEKRAIFTEPLATALHATKLSRLKRGSSCAIIGPGPIGICCVVSAKLLGAHPIILIGKDEKYDGQRLEIGRDRGADYTIYSSHRKSAREEVRELTKGEGVDVCLEASGSWEAQLTALEMVRKGGGCVFIGVNGYRKLPLVPDKLIFKEMSLSGTFLSPGTYKEAVKIIEGGRFPLENMVTHEFSLDKINDAFRLIEEKKQEVIKVVINPWK